MSYTVNPRAPQPSSDEIQQESTGPIASDSLAAESIRNKGAFAENENADVMGVKGASSTLANTDTSGATVLHASESGATREEEDAKGLGSDEKGTTGAKYPGNEGQPEFGGSHNLDGYTGGPSSGAQGGGTTSATTGSKSLDASTVVGGGSLDQSASKDKAHVPDVSSAVDPSSSEPAETSSSSGPASGAGIRPYVDSAPNYAADIRSEGDLKPKGTNLQEGDIPETKTFTGDVGGPHDPARVAEQQMLNKGASAPGEGVGGIRQSKSDMDGSTGQYDVLNVERAGDQGLNE